MQPILRTGPDGVHSVVSMRRYCISWTATILERVAASGDKTAQERKMKLCHRSGTVIIFCSAMAGATHAQDDWTNTRDSFICRSSTEIREIKTYISENGPSCRVDYIKHGTTQTIWSSSTNRSYCDGKASNLAARLGAGNFSCKPLHLQGSDKD
jgi:hypothetical protein